MLHEGKFTVHRTADGSFEFVAASGKVAPNVPVLAPADDEAFSAKWHALKENHAALADMPAWDGGPIDYDWVIQSLMMA
jgi:hypothetical protein